MRKTLRTQGKRLLAGLMTILLLLTTVPLTALTAFAEEDVSGTAGSDSSTPSERAKETAKWVVPTTDGDKAIVGYQFSTYDESGKLQGHPISILSLDCNNFYVMTLAAASSQTNAAAGMLADKITLSKNEQTSDADAIQHSQTKTKPSTATELTIVKQSGSGTSYYNNSNVYLYSQIKSGRFTDSGNAKFCNDPTAASSYTEPGNVISKSGSTLTGWAKGDNMTEVRTLCGINAQTTTSTKFYTFVEPLTRVKANGYLYILTASQYAIIQATVDASRQSSNTNVWSNRRAGYDETTIDFIKQYLGQTFTQRLYVPKSDGKNDYFGCYCVGDSTTLTGVSDGGYIKDKHWYGFSGNSNGVGNTAQSIIETMVGVGVYLNWNDSSSDYVDSTATVRVKLNSGDYTTFADDIKAGEKVSVHLRYGSSDIKMTQTNKYTFDTTDTLANVSYDVYLVAGSVEQDTGVDLLTGSGHREATIHYYSFRTGRVNSETNVTSTVQTFTPATPLAWAWYTINAGTVTYRNNAADCFYWTDNATQTAAYQLISTGSQRKVSLVYYKDTDQTDLQVVYLQGTQVTATYTKKDGYTGAGWYSNKNASTLSTTNSSVSYTATQGASRYAKAQQQGTTLTVQTYKDNVNRAPFGTDDAFKIRTKEPGESTWTSETGKDNTTVIDLPYGTEYKVYAKTGASDTGYSKLIASGTLTQNATVRIDYYTLTINNGGNMYVAAQRSTSDLSQSSFGSSGQQVVLAGQAVTAAYTPQNTNYQYTANSAAMSCTTYNNGNSKDSVMGTEGTVTSGGYTVIYRTVTVNTTTTITVTAAQKAGTAVVEVRLDNASFADYPYTVRLVNGNQQYEMGKDGGTFTAAIPTTTEVTFNVMLVNGETVVDSGETVTVKPNASATAYVDYYSLTTGRINGETHVSATTQTFSDAYSELGYVAYAVNGSATTRLKNYGTSTAYWTDGATQTADYKITVADGKYTVRLHHDTTDDSTALKIAYLKGSVVQFDANPQTGYKLGLWNTKRDASGSEYGNVAANKTLTMNKAKARFARTQQITVTITVETYLNDVQKQALGTGKEAKLTYTTPDGVTATIYTTEGTCAVTLPYGTTYTITAKQYNSAKTYDTLIEEGVIEGSKTVRVDYYTMSVRQLHAVAMYKREGGEAWYDMNRNGITYIKGTKVLLDATGAENYDFDHWETVEGCSPEAELTESDNYLTLTAKTTVKAVGVPRTHKLTVITRLDDVVANVFSPNANGVKLVLEDGTVYTKTIATATSSASFADIPYGTKYRVHPVRYSSRTQRVRRRNPIAKIFIGEFLHFIAFCGIIITRTGGECRDHQGRS